MSARLEPDQAKTTPKLSRISSDRRWRAASRLERPEVTANPIASRGAAAPAGPSRAAPHYVTLANSRTAMQEVDDKFCRRCRLFFRGPVPAIRDDHIFDVVGDTPHHPADHRAERSFATQRQDRHLKLALCKEHPVVGLILAESQELGKARSHCAGLRIERRIMLALRFIEPFPVPGKFVPEAVEIDALAAGDQALHVIPTEAKV